MSHAITSALPAQAARRSIREGARPNHTSGLARGFVQANIVIVERAWADDFLRYCQRNPKPCPLLAVSEPGDPTLPALGADLDIRTDVPHYRVWRQGELVEERDDVRTLWSDDLVTFAGKRNGQAARATGQFEDRTSGLASEVTVVCFAGSWADHAVIEGRIIVER